MAPTRSTSRSCRPFQRGRLLATVLGLAAAGLVVGAVTVPEPTQEAGGGQEAGEAKEEHGGNLVFHVVSRTQKKSVLFSHDAHLAVEGLKCEACHEGVFKKEFEGNHFKMSDVNRGRACGVCHQAEPPEGVFGAFPPKDKQLSKSNCDRCHVLRVRAPEERRR